MRLTAPPRSSFAQTLPRAVPRALETAGRRAGRRLGPGRWLFSGGLLTGALLVAALILLVPGYLVVRVAGAGGETLAGLLTARTALILGNTLALAAAVTLATTAVAVPLAWLTACTDLPGRRAWTVVLALPLVIPSYVAAYLYSAILSPAGFLARVLAPLGVTNLPDLMGFPGAFLVLTLVSYPYTFLTVRAALKRQDPALVEAARSLGLSGRQAFWRVTLPTLRPGIVAGALLVALYTLRDFGAVTMLQYSTFTRIIYNRYQGFQLDTAAGLGLMLVGLTAVILTFESRSRGRARYARVAVGAPRRQPARALGRWRWPALALTGGVAGLALFVPATGLLYWVVRALQQQWVVRDLAAPASTGAYLLDLFTPAWHSLGASLLAALLAMGLALPVAVLAVRHPGRLSRLVERLTYASFALPGIVVALALVFFSTQYAGSIYQTLPLLLAGYVILFLPQAVGAERTSLLQVAPSLEEAARGLGRRPGAVFHRITLPLVRPGMLAGGALVFLTAMKELPATLILSPLGFDTLAAQVWTHLGEAFFARAALPTLLILLLSSIPLALLMLRDQVTPRE